MGFVGFLDDYFKIKKGNKAGLRGKYKILGQILLGVFISITLYFSDHFIVYNFPDYANTNNITEILKNRDYEIMKDLKTDNPIFKK